MLGMLYVKKDLSRDRSNHRVLEKNQKRQKDLQLHWKVIKRTARCDVVEFGAYFYDISEKLYNKINGTIIFKYDANEKIKVLTEAYRKRVR